MIFKEDTRQRHKLAWKWKMCKYFHLQVLSGCCFRIYATKVLGGWEASDFNSFRLQPFLFVLYHLHTPSTPPPLLHIPKHHVYLLMKKGWTWQLQMLGMFMTSQTWSWCQCLQLCSCDFHLLIFKKVDNKLTEKLLSVCPFNPVLSLEPVAPLCLGSFFFRVFNTKQLTLLSMPPKLVFRTYLFEEYFQPL